MGLEIERKFLVQSDRWRVDELGNSVLGTVYRQGYILASQERTVRIRIAGDKAFITIKGSAIGIGRAEYEYSIPVTDATEMLDTLCDRPLIEKVRHRIPIDDLVWEVDEFSGENQGLIMAEVELPQADHPVRIPDWAGQEVTGDPRYFNAYLVKHPFREWNEG
jgi:CYTH domain-containing protein